MSFAAVYAKNIDRESIFEALRTRRTYASTDKILLDFSIEKHLMGEEAVLSDTNPGIRSARFDFRDDAYRGEDSYYYVRVIQADKNMAWASPIWVRRR